MQGNIVATISIASLVFGAGVAAATIDGPVGRDAEKGDPKRWYEPADTPRKQYDNAMQEAKAALAEALKDCRASSDRKRCEADAREQHESDVEQARGLLVKSTLG